GELVAQLRSYVNDEGTAGSALRNISVGIHLRTGKPVQQILQLATELDAGLIVVGTHKGPQLKALFVGSVAEKLIAVSPCPVLVAGPRPKAEESAAVVIEPPCPACEGARAASNGATWWCETHGHPAKQAHAFSYMREIPLSMHDSEVIPTGVKF
ncbi:MAG: universal stress protein, partial [Polyangiaceae bacterium]